MMHTKLTGHMLVREWRAGDVRILGLAVIIAVAAMTAVSFFTDRVEKALSLQANELLGADLLIRSTRPIKDGRLKEAHALQLTTTESATFPSMVMAGDQSQLVSVKAVQPGFPLRGQVRIAGQLFSKGEAVDSIPERGEVWAEGRLLSALKLQTGDPLQLGVMRFTVAGVITHEPGRGGDLFSIAPRLILNSEDLRATGLIQPGSRVRHQLYLAGEPAAVDAFYQQYQQASHPHEQLLTTEQARPEVRAALERARQFLTLAALTALIIAVFSIAVAVQVYVRRQIKQSALFRSLGASRRFVAWHYAGQWVIMASVMSLIGCVIGYVSQYWVAGIMAQGFGLNLPQPTWRPWLQGMLVGLFSLAGFILPSILRLRHVPPLLLLKGGNAHGGVLAGGWRYGIGFTALVLLMLWQTAHPQLTLYLLLATVVTFLFLSGVAYGGIMLLGKLGRRFRGAWRFGLTHPAHRAGQSVLQIIAFSSGLMALLLLQVVRDDLITEWQNTLPDKAPNRFLINIQEDQVEPLQAFYQQAGVAEPSFYPMIRGRLVQWNDRAVNPADYEEGRARRLLQREFNLSFANQPPSHNDIVQGQWWNKAGQEQGYSVEKGLADLYGMKVGDSLTFDVSGRKVTAPITNLREVDWDSFQVNFFVIASPVLLRDSPATYVTSFYLPEQHHDFLGKLVKRFPNVTVIDVAAVMEHVRGIIRRVSEAIGLIFLFTLAAGLLVMIAALHASQKERLAELNLLRILGANNKQMRQAWFTEWLVHAVVAALCACTATTLVAMTVAGQVMNIPFAPNLDLWLLGLLMSMVTVFVFAWLGGRALLKRAVQTTG